MAVVLTLDSYLSEEFSHRSYDQDSDENCGGALHRHVEAAGQSTAAGGASDCFPYGLRQPVLIQREISH